MSFFNSVKMRLTKYMTSETLKFIKLIYKYQIAIFFHKANYLCMF